MRKRVTMGVWGCGPFDSDSGMDALDDIFREAAPAVHGDAAAPEQDNQALVTALLYSAMVSSDPHVRYACAGLVAATLAEVPSAPGTSLLGPDRTATSAATLLTSSCGYVHRMSRASAEELAGQARDVLRALRDNSAWLHTFRDPDGVRTAVAAVADTLAQR